MNPLLEQSFRVLLYDETEEYKEAISSLTTFLEKNPDNSIAYNNRGLAYWEIGRIDESVKYFERAVEASINDYQD